MKQDKETKQKLLQSAKAEFMEKGYMKASLRTICKNAGVTTGALYFFFQDKADLYEAISKETVDSIYQIMQAHFAEERGLAADGTLFTSPPVGSNRDFEDSISVIHQMYLHRDDILLLLTKSQGSPLEHIEDRFVEAAEAQHRMLAQQMRQVYPSVVMDDKFIHWMAHMQIDAFIYMITHIEEETEALRYMERAISFMVKGWYGMFEEAEAAGIE